MPRYLMACQWSEGARTCGGVTEGQSPGPKWQPVAVWFQMRLQKSPRLPVRCVDFTPESWRSTKGWSFQVFFQEGHSVTREGGCTGQTNESLQSKKRWLRKVAGFWGPWRESIRPERPFAPLPQGQMVPTCSF